MKKNTGRRVLCISPHFPPVNAPDHQRVRMALPYLNEYGWEPMVLAVRPELVEGATFDPLLEQTVPSEVEVRRVSALPAGATRMVIRLGNLAIRSLPFLWREGNRLLGKKEATGEKIRKSEGRKVGRWERGKVDLVFFSTTQFPVMILGPIWKRRFGIPYVVDMQDPWFDDYYDRTGTPPPGGRFRYSMSSMMARQLEPRVMRDVSHVICVSPGYAEVLHDRYPNLRQDQFTALPFGAPDKDFELLSTLKVKQELFDQSDGRQHWVYVGRAGHDMAVALRLLFSSLQTLRAGDPGRWQNIRMHFLGTNYAPVGRGEKTAEPIARECGVGNLVEERAARIPYFESLKALLAADVLLITGSDSPSYSASKLYPYMLARRPMLSILHGKSPAAAILRECGAGNIVTFTPSHPELSRSAMAQALQKTYEMAERSVVPEINETEFAKYSAREMTRKMCEVFDRVLEQK